MKERKERKTGFRGFLDVWCDDHAVYVLKSKTFDDLSNSHHKSHSFLGLFEITAMCWLAMRSNAKFVKREGEEEATYLERIGFGFFLQSLEGLKDSFHRLIEFWCHNHVTIPENAIL